MRLPLALIERLDERADAVGVRRSELVRAALMAFLDAEAGPYDLALLPDELSDNDLRRVLSKQALSGSVSAARALLEARRPASGAGDELSAIWGPE